MNEEKLEIDKTFPAMPGWNTHFIMYYINYMNYILNELYNKYIKIELRYK